MPDSWQGLIRETVKNEISISIINNKVSKQSNYGKLLVIKRLGKMEKFYLNADKSY